MLRYLFLIFLIFIFPSAYAAKIALVIGNGAYNKNYSRLKLERLSNPVYDAIDIAKELRKLGFEVILKTNVGKKTMKAAVRSFSKRLRRRGNVGLFFFSGHGFQHNNINYLIPLKADIQNDFDIEDEAIKARYVLLNMERANKGVNIMILDACRNSIPKDIFRKSKGVFKGVSSGLTNMNAPRGSLIAYATAPDKVSWGGLPSERNSVYTKYLLKGLRNQAHFSIYDFFMGVRIGVIQETKKEEEPQVPWESISMTQRFCFGKCGFINPPPPPPPQSGVFQDTLRDGSRGPKMVWIPKGSFRMGDIQGGGYSNEKPVHRVSIGRFAMGRYEVTVGDFRQFVKATRYKTDADKGGTCWVYDKSWKKKKGANWRNPSFSQNNNHPVTCVSWNDAVAYAKWLSQQTGKKYRLPTEAEWEYAARAGTNTKYWWGNNIGKNKANCDGCGSQWDNKQTAPVGSFKANQFGIYDTVGNVWEWTCSEYKDKYQGSEKICKKRAGLFVLRGGSWGFNPRRTRSAARGRYVPTERARGFGFRLARTN